MAQNPQRQVRALLGGVLLCRSLWLGKACIPVPALSEANASGVYHPDIVAGCGVGFTLSLNTGTMPMNS